MNYDIIGLIISLLFLVFVVAGFLVGLIRGLKKTIIRSVWIIVIGVLLMFITTPIALSLLKSDVTWIPGIAEAFQGASTIEEFLSAMITQSAEGISAQDVQPLISLVTSLVAMVISGLLYLVFFIVLKFLSLPLYWILNIFIGKSKGNKRRLLGGAVGALLGVFIFTFVSMPIVGYVNAVKEINTVVGDLTQTAYVASTDKDSGENPLDSLPIDEIIEAFDGSAVMTVYHAIGIEKLQIVIFNQTSAVKISGETIKINDEIHSIGNVIVNVMPFVDGTIDVSNFEEIINDPVKLEDLSNGVSSLLGSLYESKLFTATLDTAMPILSSFVETTIKDSLLSDSSIDPTLAEPLTTMISDLFNGIANSNVEEISNTLVSIFDVVAIVPKLSGEEGINALTVEDFSKLGSVLDSLIDSGLVKEETIGELIPAVLDMALNTMITEGEIPEVVTTLINDLKQAFQSGDISYANELKVIGELVACFTSFDINEGNITAEQLKSLGASLDVAFSHNSKILTRALVDDLVIGIVDMLTENQDPELEKFSEVFELVKKPFENHEITSYEKEFDAFGEILDYVTNLDTTEELDLVEVGKKLDGVLAKDSKIINREFVNSIITILIDEFTTELDEDLKPTLEKIKENVTTKEISFEKEFGSIQKLLDTIESIEDEELDLSSIGKTLDEVIAESDIIDHALINKAINVLIDQVANEISEDYRETIDTIKDGFSGDDIVYENEFEAIDIIFIIIEDMDGEDIDLTKLGEDLDYIFVTIQSKVVTRELVNSTIQLLIDVATEGIGEENKETIDEIKNGFDRDDLIYKDEFLALDSLLDIFEHANGDSVDLSTVGKQIDTTLAIGSKIITRSLINDTIQILIDEATDGVNSEHQGTITEIKNGFTGDDLVYETEFLALESLLDIFDFVGDSDVDLAKVGEQLDKTLELNSKIITRSLINSSIKTLIDDATEGVNSKHNSTITTIKNGFTGDNLSYTTEFLALDSLLDIFDFAGGNDVDLAKVGVQLDQTLDLGSKIITRTLVNDSIQILIDDATDGVDAQYNGIISDVKEGFNSSNLTYETEFDALDKLLDVINSASVDVDLQSVGQKLDYIVDVLKSKIITRNVINTTIKHIIDESTTDIHDTNVINTVTEIKNGFNRTDLSYELELSTIDTLIEIIDKVEPGHIDLIKFGKDLDADLALNGKIITKTLINEFIASSFDTFVTADDIAHAGSLATSLSNIKVRILDNNYQIESYETEFTAVNKLIEISSVAGNISVSDIDNKLFDDNTKTIGEVFDDKIKDSVLLGDCGLDVIDSLIETLNEHNNGEGDNRDYSKITSAISQNFDAIKPSVKCASNKNLTNANTVTYTQLSNAFAEVNKYLDDTTHKVTGQTEFTSDIASYYEESLNAMQDNLLLGYNGTRAVASYICDEIATVLEDTANSASDQFVALAIRSYKKIILTYKAYLERPETLSNNRLNEKEPYVSTGTAYYVTSTDGFITNISFRTTKPASNFAYRTNPFTSIANEISAYLQ